MRWLLAIIAAFGTAHAAVTDDVALSGYRLEQMILVRAYGGSPPIVQQIPVTTGAQEAFRNVLITPQITLYLNEFLVVDSGFEVSNYIGNPMTCVSRLGLAENSDDVPGSKGWTTIDAEGGGPNITPGNHFVLQRTGQWKVTASVTRRVNLAIKCYRQNATGREHATWDQTDAKLRILIFKPQ